MLRQGRGRAVFEFRADPGRLAETLLDACLTNLRYDWLEEARAPWLAGMLVPAGLGEAAVARIVAAPPGDAHDERQRSELLGEILSEGHESARAELERRARLDDRALGALAWADEAGLAWAVEHGLPRFTDPEERARKIEGWLWDDPTDDTPLEASLRAEVAAYEASRPPALPRDDPPWEDPRALSEEEWEARAVRYLAEEDRQEASRLSRGYRLRPFPEPISRLFARADHPAVGGIVCRVLGLHDRPEVREFALALAAKRPLVPDALDALGKSARPEDAPVWTAYLEAVEAEGDEDDLHDACQDARRFDHPETLVWIYPRTPCAICRGFVVRRLVELGSVPAWIAEEAAEDSESDTRAAVARGG